MGLLKQKTLSIGQQALGLELTRSRRNRWVHFRIDPTKRLLKITAPPRVALRTIELHLVSALPWVEKTLKKLPIHQTFAAGQELCLHGQHVRLHYIQAPRSKHHQIGQELYIYSPTRETFHLLVVQYIKQRALTFFSALSHDLATKLKCTPKQIRIRDFKSCWGSCTANGTLSYSWRLMLAPLEVATYICAHEVSHLKHMNHSIAFWQTVTSLYPDHQAARAWLRHHGNSLHQYQEAQCTS